MLRLCRLCERPYLDTLSDTSPAPTTHCYMCRQTYCGACESLQYRHRCVGCDTYKVPIPWIVRHLQQWPQRLSNADEDSRANNVHAHLTEDLAWRIIGAGLEEMRQSCMGCGEKRYPYFRMIIVAPDLRQSRRIISMAMCSPTCLSAVNLARLGEVMAALSEKHTSVTGFAGKMNLCDRTMMSLGHRPRSGLHYTALARKRRKQDRTLVYNGCSYGTVCYHFYE